MRIKGVFMCLFGILLLSSTHAQTDTFLENLSENQLTTIENEDTLQIKSPVTKGPKYRESKRFVAAVLCLALGPFGMHRLYLGTKPQVAAAYSVTLGGIGIIPVVDFFLIAFSKDYSRFKDNDNVIMWGK